MQNLGYTVGYPDEETNAMPKRKDAELTNWGGRLAELRKAAGFTQEELAAEIAVSRRMIAYYEAESEHPPTALLPKLARALRISADELLGIAPAKKTARPGDNRLRRRLQQIEKLGAREKRQVLQVLDAFLEREKQRQRVSNAAERTP
jgi:transcriptional regulator with XRE-family HTH domain